MDAAYGIDSSIIIFDQHPGKIEAAPVHPAMAACFVKIDVIICLGIGHSSEDETENQRKTQNIHFFHRIPPHFLIC
jgi:hypothetical protein